jgi:cyclic pyranopterin phosphate synthase
VSPESSSRPRVALLAEGVAGREKTALSSARFSGRSLLEHQLDLARACDPCPIVLASANPRITGPYTWIQLRGPERGLLGEIATALQAAARPVVLLAVEMPLVRLPWLAFLEREAERLWPRGRRDGAGTDVPVVVLPEGSGAPEARAGLYHPDAARACHEALRAGRLDPAPVLEQLSPAIVRSQEWRALGAGDLAMFCHDPADVERAERLAAADDGYRRRERRSLPAPGRERGSLGLEDLGDAPVALHEARAAGRIRLGPQAFALLVDGALPRGDAVAAAKVAALAAVKRTAELVPLCHPQALERAVVDWRLEPAAEALAVEVTVRARGRTGVALEALHGVTVFLLTVFDMARTVDPDLIIDDVRLVAESGGREGDRHYQEAAGR